MYLLKYNRGINDHQWCGIIKETPTTTTTAITSPTEEACWSLQYNYDCCPSGTEIAFENEDGAW